MITRDPTAAAAASHDLIVIGGGIYGACMVLEASRRGLRSLLLERDDFGGATSWNSLRIVHGGLRYLQSLDLVRFRESVVERRWFLRHFPELIQPLRCVMPLYSLGLKRPDVMRVALLLNDMISPDRNRGVRSDRRLNTGRVLSRKETLGVFPSVRPEGLSGAGEWWDAVMPCPQRVLVEILRWACAHGTTALNYVPASAVDSENGRVTGVTAVDRLSGSTLHFTAPMVINCAGPWSKAFAAASGLDRQELFHPSLAFNVLLDVVPPSSAALAVAPSGRSEPVYFLYPYRGRLMAGTIHAPWKGDLEGASASEELISRFIDDLNSAVPGLDATPERVIRVFAGLLPTSHEGGCKLTKRPVIVDHGNEGGPKGFLSVSGIKLTTARLVSEQILKRFQSCLPLRRAQAFSRRATTYGIDLMEPREVLNGHRADVRTAVEGIMREEAVMTISDLVLRRTGWGDEPEIGRRVCGRLAEMFPETPETVAPEPAGEGSPASNLN